MDFLSLVRVLFKRRKKVSNNIEKIETMSMERREELIIKHGMSPYYPSKEAVHQMGITAGVLTLITRLEMVQKQLKDATAKKEEAPKTENAKSVVGSEGGEFKISETMCEILLKQTNFNAKAGTMYDGLKNLPNIFKAEKPTINLSDFLKWLSDLDPEMPRKEVIEAWTSFVVNKGRPQESTSSPALQEGETAKKLEKPSNT